jgi:GNAT superfamily N-acetyltransferase
MTIRMRDAGAGDRDAIREVTLAAYSEYAAVVPEQFWIAYRRALLETLDGAGPAERIVAERHGAVVGSVLLFPPDANAYGGSAVRFATGHHETKTAGGEYPEVRLLAVPPAARGQGVGTALMEECVRRARRSGARALGLHTMDFMKSAVRMYARLGFVRAPSLDFSPVRGIVVKGYRLDLTTPPAPG